MTTYSEKLKDPRWQQKRLAIFERDKWSCRLCGHEDKTLTVHHRFYSRDTEPWDYEDDALVTLCEPCHDSLEFDIKWIRSNAPLEPLFSVILGLLKDLYTDHHLHEAALILSCVKTVASNAADNAVAFERILNEDNKIPAPNNGGTPDAGSQDRVATP